MVNGTVGIAVNAVNEGEEAVVGDKKGLVGAAGVDVENVAEREEKDAVCIFQFKSGFLKCWE